MISSYSITVTARSDRETASWRLGHTVYDPATGKASVSEIMASGEAPRQGRAPLEMLTLALEAIDAVLF